MSVAVVDGRLQVDVTRNHEWMAGHIWIEIPELATSDVYLTYTADWGDGMWVNLVQGSTTTFGRASGEPVTVRIPQHRGDGVPRVRFYIYGNAGRITLSDIKVTSAQ